MLAGHYSAALLAKAIEPRLPLWMLTLAVQLVDVIWACFVLVGIEHLRIDPSLPSNPLDLYHMPYTHSLVAVLGWAALAGAAAFAWRREKLAAWVVAGAVASHWLLDWLVHRRDLQLWGGSAKYGLALWNHPVLAMALEAGLLIAGAWILLRSPGGAHIRRGVLIIVWTLIAVQISLLLVPLMLGPAGIVLSLLVLFAAVARGAWRAEGGKRSAQRAVGERSSSS